VNKSLFLQERFVAGVDTFIPGILYTYEIEPLKSLLTQVPLGLDILEVGPFCGRSTQIIAQVCGQSQIYSIDEWPEYLGNYRKDNGWIPDGGLRNLWGMRFRPSDVEHIFNREILKKYPNVRAIKGTFPNSMPEIESLGLFYTDNTLLEQESYLAGWDKLVSGGIWAGSRFYYKGTKLIDRIRKVAQRLNVSIICPPGTTLWYTVKP